jgi:hypothetical protein
MYIYSKRNNKKTLLKRYQKICIFLLSFIFIFIFIFINKPSSLNIFNQDLSQLKIAINKYQNYSLKDSFTKISNKIDNFLSLNSINTVQIDINQKNSIEIEKLKEIALKRGIIAKEDKIWFPGKIQSKNNDIKKIKIRLKGDNIDHLSDPLKTSFRIKLNSNNKLFGMSKFSIQAPSTRGFWGEIFYSEMMRELGVLAPRSNFIKLIYNGNDFGIMNIEESFSKELIESQQRKESVILSFNEDKIWEWWKFLKNPVANNIFYTNHKNTFIDVFSSKKIFSKPQLLGDYKKGVSLLRGYVEGKLKPNQVFDYEITSKFFAMSHILFSSSITKDGLIFNNMRFYFNPLNGKLEPISYDNHTFNFNDFYDKKMFFIGNHSGWKNHLKYDSYEAWYQKLFNDPVFLDLLNKEVIKISNTILYTDKYEDIFKLINEHYVPILREEFIDIEKFNVDKFKQRVQFVREYFLKPIHLRDKEIISLKSIDYKSKKNILDRQNVLKKMSEVIFAYDISNENENLIEIMNPLDYKIIIDEIYFTLRKSNRKMSLPLKKSLPILMEGSEIMQSPNNLIIGYEKPKNNNIYNIFIKIKIAELNKTYDILVKKNYSSASLSEVFPKTNISKELVKHDFLTFENNSLIIEEGSWTIDKMLIIPKNTKLIIQKGVNLFFKKNTGIISYAPIILQGTKKNPINMTGKGDSYWNGITVIKANDQSKILNTNLSNIEGISSKYWAITGGVSFYKSNIYINNVFIKNINTEDGLNIISSKFEINNLNIENSISDAFDSDFSQGELNGGSYINIGFKGGGDGIDFSGSNVRAKNIIFESISDKAMSIGENSIFEGSDISVKNSSVGIASKDGSNVNITHSKFEDISLSALMAYKKKQEYTNSQLTSKNITFKNVLNKAISQKGTTILIDDKKIDTESLDVNNLYNTKMKKNLINKTYE